LGFFSRLGYPLLHFVEQRGRVEPPHVQTRDQHGLLIEQRGDDLRPGGRVEVLLGRQCLGNSDESQQERGANDGLHGWFLVG